MEPDGEMGANEVITIRRDYHYILAPPRLLHVTRYMYMFAWLGDEADEFPPDVDDRDPDPNVEGDVGYVSDFTRWGVVGEFIGNAYHYSLLMFGLVGRNALDDRGFYAMAFVPSFEWFERMSFIYPSPDLTNETRWIGFEDQPTYNFWIRLRITLTVGLTGAFYHAFARSFTRNAFIMEDMVFLFYIYTTQGFIVRYVAFFGSGPPTALLPLWDPVPDTQTVPTHVVILYRYENGGETEGRLRHRADRGLDE